MTQRLVDIASYQSGLDLAAVKRAGVELVNIKTSQGDWYTHAAARGWADEARQLDLGISTFHWLDNSASGATQARIAYQRMKDIGGPDGMGHQCDNEDTGGHPPYGPATWTITRDYTDEMQQLMGRHIAMYTGDWWWMNKSRNWPGGATLTPYLWASANAGYFSAYPGDDSTHWHAGYGGWSDLSLLQYAVGPIAGAGGGNLSKTAIRDPRVWAALTGTPTQEADMSFDPPDRKTLQAIDMRLREFLKLADSIPNDLSGQPFPLPAAVALKALRDRGAVDPHAVATEVLAVLSPAAIAAAIPTELARQVADELHARLAS